MSIAGKLPWLSQLCSKIHFTSDSVIHARIQGKKVNLIIKNTGAFNTGGDGDIVDLQRIVGGTGALAGATGVLRASGAFVAGSGESELLGASVYTDAHTKEGSDYKSRSPLFYSGSRRRSRSRSTSGSRTRRFC